MTSVSPLPPPSIPSHPILGVFPACHQVPPPVAATADYVEFLEGVASSPSSSVAQVLASMAPCMRLYAFLGKVGLWQSSVGIAFAIL